MTFHQRIASFLTTGLLFVGLGVVGYSQDDQKKDQDRDRLKTEQSNTVTGCLSKGTAAGEYNLTDASGTKMMVKAAGDVNLDKHSANHTVKLTGSKSPDGSTFNATKVEHVSDTCSAQK